MLHRRVDGIQPVTSRVADAFYRDNREVACDFEWRIDGAVVLSTTVERCLNHINALDKEGRPNLKGGMPAAFNALDVRQMRF